VLGLVASALPADAGKAARTRRSVASSGSGARVQVSGTARYGYRGSVGYRSYGTYRPYWYGYGLGFYYPHYYAGYWGHPGYYGYGYYGAGYYERGYYAGRPHYTGRRGEEPPGAVDINVRPRTTEVYIDGEYMDLARNLDGYPSYLWLDEGTYEIAFYKNGYVTVARQITVRRGDLTEVRERLKKGVSERPVRPEPKSSPEEPAAEAGSEDDKPPVVITFPRRSGGGD
jgi:hypothetical protein